MKAIASLLSRGIARAGFTRAAVAVAAGSGLLLGGCASAGHSSAGHSTIPAATSSASDTSSVPASVQPASMSRAIDPHGVFGRILDQPYVTVTGGHFYVTWQNQSKHNVPSSTLTRADQATGTIEATRTFGTGLISSPQAADGSLWALLATRQETLLRMNPDTLAVTGELHISNGQYLTASNSDNHLSVAGGALWAVAGDRLVRVSLRTGRAEKVIDLPGGYSTSMAGSSSGSFLIVSVANSGGQGSLQRRDPVSGALLASHATIGVTAAAVGGVIGSGVWAAQPTGMQGYIQRYRTSTLAPVSGTAVEGSNGVGVAVANGLAWMLRSGPDGASYCANPVTGKKLAAIPLHDPARDSVIGIWGHEVYYAASTGQGEDTHLKRVAVPAAATPDPGWTESAA
jgi:hypothetical protein